MDCQITPGLIVGRFVLFGDRARDGPRTVRAVMLGIRLVVSATAAGRVFVCAQLRGGLRRGDRAVGIELVCVGSYMLARSLSYPQIRAQQPRQGFRYIP